MGTICSTSDHVLYVTYPPTSVRPRLTCRLGLGSGPAGPVGFGGEDASRCKGR